MHLRYGKQDMPDLNRAQEICCLVTNGLGGYASQTAGFGVCRSDQAILAAAVKAPNVRRTLVHRLKETLTVGHREYSLSTQRFADGTPAEEGYRNLTAFVCREGTPVWTCGARGVEVRRELAMAFEENTVGIQYTIENRSGEESTLTIVPSLKFAPKEDALEEKKTLVLRGNTVTDGVDTLYVHTDAALSPVPLSHERLSYHQDAEDGRPAMGYAAMCCALTLTVPAGETKTFSLVFSTEAQAPAAGELLEAQARRAQALLDQAGLRDPPGPGPGAGRRCIRCPAGFHRRQDHSGGLPPLQRLGPGHHDRPDRLLPVHRPL